MTQYFPLIASATHCLAFLDWVVIAVYAIGLLAVGWYYSRRTQTREQYLLGDRKMNPLMVGLSLFAALISTISYLAIPGEIVKYGPMILAELLSYPLIALVVGYLVIPFIMRLKVTSAYEILETRLGPTVRTIGSVLFLMLRLSWMAVIVYATTSKVLIPLSGLDPSFTPLVGIVMALVAIAYTSMGGLRAAVVTDVIQSTILFSAAIVVVIIIVFKLGGLQPLWPEQWPAHWQELKVGYDPSVRITVFGAALAMFTWYVCTSASDQIVVQRYLSTRDAKSARGVLFISLAAGLFVEILLGIVGLGLLAYFNTFPEMLPASQDILKDSDKLFSHFIVIALPPGVSGLIVAGLLACAMSSLAAGISSTCSVISVDVMSRMFSKTPDSDAKQVGQLRYISIVVGAAVVLLSLLVNMVEGNLWEICYKVVNLLTAPLAGLFFLAMFVPWSRGFGAIVGLACGLATVIAVNFWKEITGTPGISFLWAMPLCLVVEVGVGALASLIPIGHKSTVPLEKR